MTFPELGMKIITENFKGELYEQAMAQWKEKMYTISITEAHDLAKKLGFSFKIDWKACRSTEGFYRVKGCVEYCAQRGLIFSEYADVLWMETSSPDLKEAQNFADQVHKYKPDVMLSYNLSPSFNWEKAGYSNEELEQLIKSFGNFGYCWQFITLAGFHMNALVSEIFTRNFAARGMLSYVQDIQQQEKI